MRNPLRHLLPLLVGCLCAGGCSSAKVNANNATEQSSGDPRTAHGNEGSEEVARPNGPWEKMLKRDPRPRQPKQGGETIQSVGTGEALKSGETGQPIQPGQTIQPMQPVEPMQGGEVGGKSMALPGATVYRMSGDFADRVPVQVGPDGKLVSFPAPSDIPADAAPLQLTDGWWISPVGVSRNSVFTRWTYAEYRALKQVPTPDEILANIIPGAGVTFVKQLPMTMNEALADTAAVNSIIRSDAFGPSLPVIKK